MTIFKYLFLLSVSTFLFSAQGPCMYTNWNLQKVICYLQKVICCLISQYQVSFTNACVDSPISIFLLQMAKTLLLRTPYNLFSRLKISLSQVCRIPRTGEEAGNSQVHGGRVWNWHHPPYHVWSLWISLLVRKEK